LRFNVVCLGKTMDEKTSIKIFATGGTIDKSMFSYETLNYEVAEPQIQRILEQSNVRFKYDIESICKKDSLALTNADRDLLLNRVKECTETKIIVTHGTDTATETADFLKEVSGKTIVITGSMLPAKFHDTDAFFNIGGAIIAVQTLPPGIYLIMNGLVLNPLDVRKNISTSDYEKIR